MSDALAGSAALVTGGAGFIGSHLTEALVRRGARVTVVDDFSSGRLANLARVADQVGVHHLDLHRADLCEWLSRLKVDVIFHLAGDADIPGSIRNPARDLDINGLTTFRLLEAMRQASPQSRMVFASSAAVYGEARDRPLDEDAPTVPVAPYGVSKLMGERYLAVYARLYDLRAASLRLFPVYGPRLSVHVVYDLIAKVCANPKELVIIGDGEQVRDFTYVSDAVDAFLLVAAQAPLRGEAYNVASGRPLSIRELAEAICREMGESPRFVYTGQHTPGVSRRWTADISRIETLGFRPQTSLGDALGETIRWVRDAARTTSD